VMGYKTVEVRDSLLSQARSTRYLVVLEQDVRVDVQVSQMLWNIPLFEKTKVIHAYGKGAFGIDLSDLTEDAVQIDHNIREVVLILGGAELLYVENDYEKTTYEETEHALLAFGDIRLTAEQQTVVDRDIQNAMKKALEEGSAREEAKKKIRRSAEAFFAPIIHAIVPGYEIIVR
ncbi:MAG TPA: DUF4230 domain-containing protein, partial [Anaerovoracaceae bacterium]|nr:DUF4230 domain-containing protein [Anaerovoracaceae bacterium]